MTAMPPTHARADRKPWQVALVTTAVSATALLLIAYAAAGSYDGLWHLAAAHHVPLPRLNPLGLDGGLVGIVALSIGLTWLGHNLPWLRLGGRLFAAGTVAANTAAGWPDPIAVLLRAGAPLLLVLITEAVYAVLLGRNTEVRDRIPLARWILAPWPTFRLWRRMVLWRVNSYAQAVDMELARLRAIKTLTAHYRGRDWRQHAPADVVWMLTSGVKMADALAAVKDLTGPPGKTPGKAAGKAAGKGGGGVAGKGHGKAAGKPPLPGTDEALAAWVADTLGRVPVPSANQIMAATKGHFAAGAGSAKAGRIRDMLDPAHRRTG